MADPPVPPLAHDFEDVRAYTLGDADEAELVERQTECTFIWSGRDGHPLGVIMNYIYRRDRFWLTATTLRARIAAIRRDPRVSIAISSKGADISARRSLTYKGTCIVHDDQATLDWFVADFSRAMRPDNQAAAEAFADHLRSPGRVVIELIPDVRIGFDSSKMWAAAPSAAPSD